MTSIKDSKDLLTTSRRALLADPFRNVKLQTLFKAFVDDVVTSYVKKNYSRDARWVRSPLDPVMQIFSRRALRSSQSCFGRDAAA